MTPAATFAFLHGAGGRGADWDLVGAELGRRGHRSIGIDLPCEEEVGLEAYVTAVVDVLGDRDRDRAGDLVLVGHSLAGLVAPLVAARVDVDLLVLAAAMVPEPGESGGQWWERTGHAEAMAALGLPDDDEETVFLHDVPAAVLAAVPAPRGQTSTLFEEPWPLPAWPDTPTRFLAFADDRFFPLDWLTGVVRGRLGIEALVVPGGHCAYLSQPVAVAEALDACWRDEAPTRAGQGVDFNKS